MAQIKADVQTAMTKDSTWQARFEERFENFSRQLEQVAADLKSITNQQQSSGRWNWQTFGAIAGVILAGVVMIGTANIAFINVRVAPIESAVASSTTERASLLANIERIEGDRHRDQADMDTRLQREMRLVGEIVAKQGEANKDATIAISKRVDDVTYRFDELRKEQAEELLQYKSIGLEKALGITK